jgi:hypothetical protein
LPTAALDKLETSNYLTRDVTREDGVDSPEKRAARENEISKVGESGRFEAVDTLIRDPNPAARFDAMKPEVSRDAHSSTMLKDFSVTDGQKVIADGSDIYKPRETKDAGGPVDSADKLLAKNPELKLDPATKGQLDKEIAAQAPEVARDVATFNKLHDTMQDRQNQLEKDLADAGIDRNGDPVANKAAWDKLTPDEQTALGKEEDKFRTDAKLYRGLAHELPQRDGELYSKTAAANFEQNLAVIEKKYSPDVKSQIYSSLDSVMNNKQESHPVSDADRTQYAQLLARQLAHPEERICQGNKGTCQAADVQQILLQKDPAFYAQQAASIVTEGAILRRAGDGASQTSPVKEVLLSPAQLRDDANPGRDPLSHAMQTAIADKMVKTYDPSQGYHYIDAKPGEAPKINVGSPEKPTYEDSATGEYVTSKDGQSYPFMGGHDSQMTKVLSEVTGDKYTSSEKQLTGISDLKQALSTAGDKYPVIIAYQDSKESHVVNITGYDSSTGKYSIMNSQKYHADKPEQMTADELYKSFKDKQEKYAKTHPDEHLQTDKMKISLIYEK